MLSKPGVFDAHSADGTPPPPEGYIQPNLGHGLRIWWAYYWPTFLITTFVVAVLTVLLRKAWENMMVSGHEVLWANRVLPDMVLAVVSLLGIRRILGKKFRTFETALVPRDATLGSESLTPSFQRVIRVWWAFTWRTIVFSVIFRLAGSIGLVLIIGFLTAIAGPFGGFVPFIFQILIDAAVGLFVVYSAILDEEFGDFRVTLVPRPATLSAADAVPSVTTSSTP